MKDDSNVESYDIGFGLEKNVTVPSHGCGRVEEAHSSEED
jgi:hypothetical protein